jgi:hypothetical protein
MYANLHILALRLISQWREVEGSRWENTPRTAPKQATIKTMRLKSKAGDRGIVWCISIDCRIRWLLGTWPWDAFGKAVEAKYQIDKPHPLLAQV